MGLFKRAATKRGIDPQPIAAGPWLNQALQGHDIVPSSRALHLLLFNTLRSTESIGQSSSSWRLDSDTTTNSVVEFSRSTTSMVRYEAINDRVAYVTCHALGPWGTSQDWKMRVSLLPGEEAITVPEATTLDDGLVNKGLFRTLRERITNDLLTGSATTSAAEGTEALQAAIENGPCPISSPDSPFADDAYFAPEVLRAFRYPLRGQTFDQVRDRLLSGGGDVPAIANSDGSIVWIAETGVNDVGINLKLLDEGGTATLLLADPVDPRRTTLRLLIDTLRGLRSNAGADDGLNSQLDGAIAAASAGWDLPLRTETQGLHPSWDDRNAADWLPSDPTRLLPVGIRVTTNVPPHHFLPLMRRAAAKVPAVERFRATGFRQATIEKSALRMQRSVRCLLNREDNSPLDLARFTQSRVNAPLGVVAGGDDDWMWETQVVLDPQSGDRTVVGLDVTGLSRTGPAITYGGELTRYLAAFYAAYREVDQEATAEVTFLNGMA